MVFLANDLTGFWGWCSIYIMCSLTLLGGRTPGLAPRGTPRALEIAVAWVVGTVRSLIVIEKSWGLPCFFRWGAEGIASPCWVTPFRGDSGKTKGAPAQLACS